MDVYFLVKKKKQNVLTMTRSASPPLLLLTLFTLLRYGAGAADRAEFLFKPPNQDSANIYFAECFTSPDALQRFVPSKASKDGVDENIAKYDGRWEVAPVEASSLQGDLSLIMKDKAKHHAIAAQLKRTFHPLSKPLIFQYEVKFQTENSCGGAYVKLLSQDPDVVDFAKFHDKSPYTIMFGPDRCGTQEKFHFILRHVHPVTGAIEEKHAKKPEGFNNKFFETGKTRLYRLVLYPDSSYEMSVDRQILSKGHLLSDMTPAIIPEELIDDANEEKPDDWDDREKIPDPEDEKPENWDEAAPKQIEDPNAVKPEGWLDHEEPSIPDVMAERPADWDDEMDGEWEAPLVENPRCGEAPGCGPWSPPLIDNPEYKGVWRPALIENPLYKGIWKPRKIKNPEYFEETNPFERITPIDAIGLELWTMSENVAFDNFILADDVGVVERWTDETWGVKTAREGATAPSGPTVLHQLFDAANERPWLWLVYVIGLLIPICIMTMIFCPVKKDKGEDNDNGESLEQRYDAIPETTATTTESLRETKEEEAFRKKTDEPLPDVVDEAREEDVEEEREEEEEEEVVIVEEDQEEEEDEKEEEDAEEEQEKEEETKKVDVIEEDQEEKKKDVIKEDQEKKEDVIEVAQEETTKKEDVIEEDHEEEEKEEKEEKGEGEEEEEVVGEKGEEADEDEKEAIDSVPPIETTPIKESVLEKPMDDNTTAVTATTNGLTNGSPHGSPHGTSNGFEDDGEEEDVKISLGKSVLSGLSEEVDILRRSPRLRKVRSRKE